MAEVVEARCDNGMFGTSNLSREDLGSKPQLYVRSSGNFVHHMLL